MTKFHKGKEGKRPQGFLSGSLALPQSLSIAPICSGQEGHKVPSIAKACIVGSAS